MGVSTGGGRLFVMSLLCSTISNMSSPEADDITGIKNALCTVSKIEEGLKSAALLWPTGWSITLGIKEASSTRELFLRLFSSVIT